MEEVQQYSTFFIDDLFFGIEVVRVQEVIKYQHMTHVPLASKIVEGLINLRGQIVTAIDLRRRLELGERPEGEKPMNVVIRTNDGAVSLLVDSIGDVLAVSKETLEFPPSTVTGLTRELVTAVHKLADRLLLVLDTDKVIAVTQEQGSKESLRLAPAHALTTNPLTTNDTHSS